MKKTTITIAAAVATLAVLAGCSGGSAPASDGSSAAPEPATSAAVEAPAEDAAAPAESDGGLLGSGEWPESETTEAVPVPKFSVPPIDVTESNGCVNARYENVPESEAAAYVDEVKAAGFTYDVTEQKSTEVYTFGGQNAENILDSTSLVISYYKDGSMQIIVSNHTAM